MASSTVVGVYQNFYTVSGYPLWDPAALDIIASFVRVQVSGFNPDGYNMRQELKERDPSILQLMYILGTESTNWQEAGQSRPNRNQWSYKGGTQGEPSDWDYLTQFEAWFIHTISSPVNDPTILDANGNPIADLSLGSSPPGSRVKSLAFLGDYQMNFAHAGYREWVQARALEFMTGRAPAEVAAAGAANDPGINERWRGAHGLYMDNIWAGWTKTQQNACVLLYGHNQWNSSIHGSLLAEYPDLGDEEAFRNDMLGFLVGLRGALGPDTIISGNTYAAPLDGQSLNRYYIERVDGADVVLNRLTLNESFVTDFPSTAGRSVAAQENDLIQTEWIAAHRGMQILHPQGTDWDMVPYTPHSESFVPPGNLSQEDYGFRVVPQRMRHAHAAYFLVQPVDASRANPNITFRYHGAASTEFRTYPGYELDLGGAKGPRYKVQEVITDPRDPWYTNGVTPIELWKRDFANGQAVVYPDFRGYSWEKQDQNFDGTPDTWTKIRSRGDGRIVMSAAQPGQRRWGKQTAGASNGSADGDRVYLSRYVMPEAGRIIKLTLYTNGQGSGAGSVQALRGVIYNTVNGVPTTLIRQAVATAVWDNQASGWVDLEFDFGFDLPAGTYAIGVHTGRNSAVSRLFYDTVGTTQAWRYDAPAGSWPNGAPATLGTLVNQGRNYSIYATYIAAGVPLAPANLQAHPLSTEAIHLTWQNNATDAHGLELQRTTTPDMEASWERVAMYGANAVSHVDTMLEPNVTYHYRARAWGRQYTSSWANVAYATTWDDHIALRATAVNFTLPASDANPQGEPTTVLAVAIPPDRRVGDLELLQVTIAYNAASGADNTTTGEPQDFNILGWTKLRSDWVSFTQRTVFFYRLSPSDGAGSVAAGWSGLRHAKMVLALYRNVDLASPVTAHSGMAVKGAHGTAGHPEPSLSGNWEYSAASITTLHNREKLVVMGANNVQFADQGLIQSSLKRWHAGDETYGTQLADETWIAPGATGTRGFVLPTKVSTASHQAVIQMVALKPRLEAPPAPSAPSATEAVGALTLRWSDDSERTVGYQLERRRQGESAWALVAQPYAPRYVDADLDNAGTYEYRVRGWNLSGVSAWSATYTINPTVLMLGPDASYVRLMAVPGQVEGTRFIVEGSGYRPRRSRAGEVREDAAGATQRTRATVSGRRYALTLLAQAIEPDRRYGSRHDLEGLLRRPEALYFVPSGGDAPLLAKVVGEWEIQPASLVVQGQGAWFRARVELVLL
jgi:hypothetical protein